MAICCKGRRRGGMWGVDGGGDERGWDGMGWEGIGEGVESRGFGNVGEGGRWLDEASREGGESSTQGVPTTSTMSITSVRYPMRVACSKGTSP